MANPLQELALKPTGFQFIQELPINAPPAKVWASLLNVGGWFGFDPDRNKWPKGKLEPRAGGQWIIEHTDGSISHHATIALFEPNKLLRLSGSMGMTHLPVSNAVIFELQPKDDGKTTLLRLGHRAFGFLDADIDKRYQGAWGKLLPNLKALSEKH